MKSNPFRSFRSKATPLLSLIAGLCVAAGFPTSRAAAGPLGVEDPIVVPDSKGGFDYLQVDEANRRLLANHTGNNTLDVFDADTGKLLKHIATGKAQGVAIDSKAGKYFVSVSAQKKMVVIDSKTLAKTGELALGGPGDSICFDPKRGEVYIGHDDATDLWVINGATEKLVATIKIAEGPEYVLYDPATDRVFQNIKSNDTLLVIDPATHTVKETWPTAPAKHPHGLALDVILVSRDHCLSQVTPPDHQVKYDRQKVHRD